MTSELTNVKAILFDLDETLIDAAAGLKDAHRNAVIKKLREYFPSEFSDYSDDFLREKIMDFDDRMNLKTQYDRDKWWPKILQELDVNRELNSNQIKELTKTYWDTYIESAEPYDDVQSTLEYLKNKGYSLGVVTDTDNSGRPKEPRVTKLEFSNLLDTIVVGGEDTEKTKPSPQSFELAAERLKVKPFECLAVGDKPFADIKGAKSAGMKAIWVKRREWDSEEEPDMTINSIKELKELF
ncbi:MAG: HAD-IIIA family hydrolase [Hadesarchaea archaeon]|nr:HAD-IIIA family hydrolase [Hadesarchaea archaeon]